MLYCGHNVRLWLVCFPFFVRVLQSMTTSNVIVNAGGFFVSDAEKQRTIASVINGIVVSQQMSQNYQQGVETQQNQQEAVQRK